MRDRTVVGAQTLLVAVGAGITGLVLLLAAGVDAISRRKAVATR